MAREPYTGDVSLLVNRDAGYYDGEFDDNGRLMLVEGPAEVAQAAELRLALWRGGWRIDPTHGFPWTRFLGRKDVTPALMAMAVRGVVMRDERIRQMGRCDVEFVDLQRRMTVAWEGQTADGYSLKHDFAVRLE